MRPSQALVSLVSVSAFHAAALMLCEISGGYRQSGPLHPASGLASAAVSAAVPVCCHHPDYFHPSKTRANARSLLRRTQSSARFRYPTAEFSEAAIALERRSCWRSLTLQLPVAGERP